MPEQKKKIKFRKVGVNNFWVETAILAAINVGLLGVIIYVYRMTTRLPYIIGFLFVLTSAIFFSYKNRFESLNFDLSKKGKIVLFLRACLPYILQALFFAQCALVIAWILFIFGDWK